MEVKITRNEKEEMITLKNPKGREVKKGLKLLFDAQKQETDEEQVAKLEEYVEYLDVVASENVGMTIDELDDLDTDEKTNIVQFYAEKINGRLDFLKSSLTRQN